MTYPKEVVFDAPVEYKGFDLKVAATPSSGKDWHPTYQVYQGGEKLHGAVIATIFFDPVKAKAEALTYAKDWVTRSLEEGNS